MESAAKDVVSVTVSNACFQIPAEKYPGGISSTMLPIHVVMATDIE